MVPSVYVHSETDALMRLDFDVVCDTTRCRLSADMMEVSLCPFFFRESGWRCVFCVVAVSMETKRKQVNTAPSSHQEDKKGTKNKAERHGVTRKFADAAADFGWRRHTESFGAARMNVGKYPT